MACAACSRRLLSTSYQSLPGFYARARAPRRFALPQAQPNWISSPAPFSTRPAPRAATNADSEATTDATASRDTDPHHEHELSSPTIPEPETEPALSELQDDLGLSGEHHESVENQLFKLTGRKPGRPQKPEPTVQSRQFEDAHHEREDVIAKLVMGQISQEEANARLAKVEPQSQTKGTAKRPKERKKSVPRKHAKSQGGKNVDKENAAVKKPGWMIQKEALEQKFEGASWRPAKRVSPDAVLGIRELHKSDRATFTVELLAERFKISKEAVRRILKSKFEPTKDEMADKRKRWERRGEAVWKKLSDTGVRPPKKWREMGVSQGPAPWKKGRNGHRPKDTGYAWEQAGGALDRPKENSIVGRIE